MPVSAHQQGDGALTPANHFGGSFGPNEWLVDEMYQNYLADPNSVDPAWHDFFSDFSPRVTNNSSTQTLPPLPTAPRGGTPPLPKAASKESASKEVPSTISSPQQTVAAVTSTPAHVPAAPVSTPAPTPAPTSMPATSTNSSQQETVAP